MEMVDYKVIATKKQAEKAHDNCLVLSCINFPPRRYTCGAQSGSGVSSYVGAVSLR